MPPLNLSRWLAKGHEQASAPAILEKKEPEKKELDKLAGTRVIRNA